MWKIQENDFRFLSLHREYQKYGIVSKPALQPQKPNKQVKERLEKSEVSCFL